MTILNMNPQGQKELIIILLLLLLHYSTMLPAWEKIQNELLDTSNIHATFATKMTDDIEKSLRSAIVNDQAYAEVRSVSIDYILVDKKKTMVILLLNLALFFFLLDGSYLSKTRQRL